MLINTTIVYKKYENNTYFKWALDYGKYNLTMETGNMFININISKIWEMQWTKIKI